MRFTQDEYSALAAVLLLVCGSPVEAEDAVQEALSRAVFAQRRGFQMESLAASIRVVELNLLRHRWRSLLGERFTLSRCYERTSHHAHRELDTEIDLRRALWRLSRRQREAVALHYRLGLSVMILRRPWA